MITHKQDELQRQAMNLQRQAEPSELVACVAGGISVGMLYWTRAAICLKYVYIFLFYSFVYIFIALPQGGSVCRFIFFYKFNCTDPGLQLGEPAPLIGLLLYCGHFFCAKIPPATPLVSNREPVHRLLSWQNASLHANKSDDARDSKSIFVAVVGKGHCPDRKMHKFWIDKYG